MSTYLAHHHGYNLMTVAHVKGAIEPLLLPVGLILNAEQLQEIHLTINPHD